MAATRTSHQREEDLPLINAWYLQGKSQRWIADELTRLRSYDLTHQTITNDLKEIRKRWKDNTVIPLDDHKMKELARLDLLENEYWSQWLLSKEPRKITSKAAKSKPGGKDSPATEERSASERIEQREGNPAFLQGVERCIKMRVDLLGLNAPVKHDQSGTVKHEHTGTLNVDERRSRVAELLDRARTRRDGDLAPGRERHTDD